MDSRGIEAYLFFKQYHLKHLPYEGVFFMTFGTLIAYSKVHIIIVHKGF